MTFDMSEAWQEATAMIRANRELLMVIAGIFFFLPSVASTFIMPGMDTIFANPEAMQAQVAAYYADYWWVMLLSLLVQVVGYLALLALLRDRRRPTVGEAIGAGLKGLLPAIATVLALSLGLVLVGLVVGLVGGLLAGVLGVAGGTIVGVAFGLMLLIAIIVLMIRLSLWAPVIAIDKVGNPLRVLGRSWQLTRGNALRLFVFFALLFLVYFVLSIVIGLVVTALTFALGAAAALIVAAVLAGLIGAIAAVIYVAVLAAVHRQLAGPADAERDTFA